MSGVVISKSPSVVVAPSETLTATGGDISLSVYDKITGGSVTLTVFFVFEHAIQEPVETVKRALSQALAHYYPMAGRFATAADDEAVVIKCTGEGVPFVAASANCALQDVEALSDRSLQQELGVFLPEITCGRYYSEVDPFIAMQVTVFSCGGFILGVKWNHAVADGIGIGQFVQAVAELARGLPSPSVVPVRQDESVMLNPPPSPRSSELWVNLQLSELAAVDITIKPSLINRIKDKYASISTNNSGRPCTVFEAIAAVLWRCRTRAIRPGQDELAVLCFGADARQHVGAKEGYYGNCVMTRLVTASSGAVGNGDFMDLVKTIRRAKDGEPTADQSDLDQLDSYNVFGLTNWRNIGLEAPDFGGGRPATVKCFSMSKEKTMPGCVTCIPCKDEYSVLSICVKEDHAGAFLQEIADMHLNYI